MSPKALLLVDLQYDFLPPNGSLAVPGGDEILPRIYDLLSNAEQYNVIVASMDYHPKGHVSFASTHSKEPFNIIAVPKLHAHGETVAQMLWPDHCVQDTPGCQIEEGVRTRLEALGGDKVKYIHKGNHIDVDAYSAFSDNAYTSFTPLAQILHERGIEEVDVAGLAFDYCVKFTLIDACKFNFVTRLLRSATRAVEPWNEEHVLHDLQQWGVRVAE